MKANELRIGNYVRDIEKSVYVSVIGINDPFDDVWLRFNERLIDYKKKMNEITSIPLTEEWLIKFGIKRLNVSGFVISGATYWRYKDITFYQVNSKFYMPIGEKLSDQIGQIAIVFDKVHELQNIFALTGEELEISK